jgi:hypothetical protein
MGRDPLNPAYGRASVLASPNFEGILQRSGLAGTLALPKFYHFTGTVIFLPKRLW